MRKMKDSGIEWIGEIPEDWETTKLKYIASVSSGEMISKYEYIEDGIYDIVGSNGIIGKSNKFNNTKKCLTTGRVGSIGTVHIVEKSWITDNALIVYPNDLNILKWLYYIIPNFDYKFISSGTAQPLITATKLLFQVIPFPPLAEQQKISAFLDRKCTEIDSVISKTKATIEEYKKLKQSVITQAVTKGIIPNRPMKDSIVEFNDNIPIDWNEVKLKYLCYLRARLGWRGLKADEYVESGYIFLSAFNIINNKLDFSEVNYINQFRYDESPEIKLRLGDILIVKDGAGIGKCAYIDYMPKESTPNGSLAVITPNNNLYGKYLYYFFLSNMFQNRILQLKDGMGVPHLFQGDMREIIIPVPPKDEQQEIVNYLDEKCSEIDKLIAKKEQLLTEMENYKKAVIYEYVTGKKEVE